MNADPVVDGELAEMPVALDETEVTVGSHIRARRKKIGMKQSVLAEETGISAAQLCHIEKDGVEPSIKTLKRIAKALGTTPGVLFGVNAELGKSDAEFTAGSTGGDALASDALAKGVTRGEQQDSSAVAPPTFPGGSPHSAPVAPLRLDPVTGMACVHDPRDTAVDRRVRARLRKEIKSWRKLERAAGITRPSPTLPLFFPAATEFGALLAREVRMAAGIGPSAIVDPVALLETKGFRVLVTKLPSGLDSWSLWDPQAGNAFLFLRDAATPERRRFRAAFELGHLARFVSGGFRPLRDIGVSRKISRAFAAAFLLPEEAVREAAHGLAIGTKDWTWELALALKSRFGVSAETFLYRIEELGMISRERNREFRAKLASIYARCRETGRRNFEPQAPDGADSRFGALSIRAKLQESLSGKGGSLQDFAPPRSSKRPKQLTEFGRAAK